MTNKVIGIKSVDFKVKAVGSGVVNWNGTTIVRGSDGIDLKNHSMPKLRGYTNETGKEKEETGFRYKKLATEINFKETPMYISQNCIRHHMFKEQAFDFHFANEKNEKDGKSLKSLKHDSLNLLVSLTGLLRGYVIPTTQCKRKSPILIEDFVDQLGNGNFEQFGNSGVKDVNSFYSKTTFGKTEYLSHGSISIEDLQFISLDKKFDRQAYPTKNEEHGIEIAKKIQNCIIDLDPSKADKVKAEFGKYKRVGTIFDEAEIGILLNEEAIDVLVKSALEIISELSIKQAKGWMSVSDVQVDYNDSKTMMRIILEQHNIEEEKTKKYAQYYEKVGA